MRSWTLAVACGLSLLPSTAAAHAGTGLAGGFWAGFVHPLSGLDHLLAMVALGLWGSFLGRPMIYLLPMTFPALMVVGDILGMLRVPLPPLELGIALSVWVLGGCIALAVRARPALALLVVAVFAAFHGYAHGTELPSAADPVGYSAGFVVATGLLHVSGICLGFLNHRPRGELATRSVGVVIAGVGVWFLAKAIGG